MPKSHLAQNRFEREIAELVAAYYSSADRLVDPRVCPNDRQDIDKIAKSERELRKLIKP